MLGRVRHFAWIAMMIIAPAVLHAQGNVLVTLLRPPPNQLRVADLWKVDLNNTTDETFTVYLHGTADEASDGRIVDARSKPFRLLPRQRVRVLGSMLEPITVDEWNDDYKDVIFRSGQVPTGSYTVCVEVLRAEDDSLLGTDCYEQPVDIEQLSPPILVFPLDESLVTERLPTFNWLPPTPVRQGDRMHYQLRIVEVLGRQTAFDAMASNPAFFDLREITTNSFRFPMGARGFQVGRTYAWQIRAFLSERFTDRIPVGESEIWWFTYGKIGDDLSGEEDTGGRDIDIGQRDPTGESDKDTDTGIDVAERGLPTFGGRTAPNVIVDKTIRKDFLPPQYDLAKEFAVDDIVVKLNPMLLRALLHTCQGMN